MSLTWAELQLGGKSYVKSNCRSPLLRRNLLLVRSRQLAPLGAEKSVTHGITWWQQGSPNLQVKTIIGLVHNHYITT